MKKGGRPPIDKASMEETAGDKVGGGGGGSGGQYSIHRYYLDTVSRRLMML